MVGSLQSAAAPARVRVWDLPTRLFHWALALLVVFSFATAKIGGAWTDWHFRSGYAILTLLLFRVLWGFAGSRYARFATYAPGPTAIAAYLRSGNSVAGHSPLAALAVLAMLAALLVQASAGLFAADDIGNEGPLLKYVSNATGAVLTRIHRFNEKVLIALIALHVGSIAYYYFVRRKNLVASMLTGDQLAGDARPARDDAAMRVRAALLLALAAALVAYVVNL